MNAVEVVLFVNNPVTNVVTVTVHCPCGQEWSYTRPRRYAGHAFDTKRCPRCDNHPEMFGPAPIVL